VGGGSSRLETPAVGAALLAPGTRIRHYELVRELGRGGMGIVYEARDVKLGRSVAIKLLHTTTREVAARFVVEASATARCNHENIVVIHEIEEYEGIPYMVLELIEGSSLRDLMGPWGEATAIEPARVIELMLPVARALRRAHGSGIVHRDLKPENVLVTAADQVKVLDFGIAKALGDAADPPGEQQGSVRTSDKLQLTADGAIVGTLPYMSPEQMGVGEVDHRSDLWAFGIITYELLAGRHPVEPVTSEALIANLVGDEPMASARGIVGIPPKLAELVDRCLAKAKADRIESAAAVVSALEAMRVEGHQSATAMTPAHAIAPPVQRRSRWPAAIASALVVAAIAAVIVVATRTGEQAAPAAPVATPTPRPPAQPAPQPAAKPPEPAPIATPPVAPVEPAPIAKPLPKPKTIAKPRPQPAAKPAAGSGAGSGSARATPCDVYTDRAGC
jgi:serine/threonine protein kinase